LIKHYENLQELSAAAAECVCQLAADGVKTRGVFTAALSGGTTPRTLYELLARPPYRQMIPWADMYLFWGDERYVPPDHPDSNFAMASHTLIDHAPVPAQNIHRIPTESASPAEAAEMYAQTLHTLFAGFGALSEKEGLPMFDLMLLGLGPDGHTASLFPDSPVLNEQHRWVTATPVPKLVPRVQRITLTLPVINTARHVIFLAAGAEKQPILQVIWKTPDEAWERYPAARVKPSGKLMWFVAKN
jgi:6-phosphogluconolactonase